MKKEEQIPEFARRTLRSEVEAQKWLNWYNNLAVPDQRNFRLFLDGFNEWRVAETKDLKHRKKEWKKERGSGKHNSEFLKGDYFVLSAIGSTLRGPDYHDVDLLVVTNRIHRDMDSIEDLLEGGLKKHFQYTVDPTIAEAYDLRPNRILVTLTPEQGKPMHVTVQPEINDEELWMSHDKKPLVVLYRKGDTSGYHDTFEAYNRSILFLERLLKPETSAPKPE